MSLLGYSSDSVPYPFTLRDTILRAAGYGFFQLRWSREILDEMERNLVANGVMPEDRAARLRSKMEEHFPEAEVTGYELPNRGGEEASRRIDNYPERVAGNDNRWGSAVVVNGET